MDQHKNEQIDKLFQSITKLSVIYKEMNQLVIDQGSIVDRIDYNVEATLKHTKKAVVHLEGANEAASSPFADRVIKSLVITVIVLLIVLGYKFSAS
jgi:syntaxin 16